MRVAHGLGLRSVLLPQNSVCGAGLYYSVWKVSWQSLGVGSSAKPSSDRDLRAQAELGDVVRMGGVFIA